MAGGTQKLLEKRRGGSSLDQVFPGKVLTLKVAGGLEKVSRFG